VAVPEQDPNTRILRFPAVTVRRVENPAEAEELLPLPVLRRLCSGPGANRSSPCDVYLSEHIVALDGEYAVGFAAYTPSADPRRSRNAQGPPPLDQAARRQFRAGDRTLTS
jgi:hypothetical protein